VDLEELVAKVRAYRGVSRKAPIADVARRLICTHSSVVAAHGEDAAVIRSGKKLLLLAADGILEDLVRKDPYWAGYCSVLVNVNDIAAMGGRPLAMVNVLSCQDEAVRARIIEGMRDACSKFDVPMVGGHLHPDTSYSAIDVAILGETDREHLVLSSGAMKGDSVVFAMDLAGKFTPGIPYSWDTTTSKSQAEVKKRISVMRSLGPFLTAGKDISNPGSLGTLGMLLEASGKGASVDLLKIPIPRGVDLLQWLMAYQGCGFVVTCRPRDARRVVGMFGRAGLTASACGEVKSSSSLEVELRGRRSVLFDFRSDTLGCAPPQKL